VSASSQVPFLRAFVTALTIAALCFELYGIFRSLKSSLQEIESMRILPVQSGGQQYGSQQDNEKPRKEMPHPLRFSTIWTLSGRRAHFMFAIGTDSEAHVSLLK
jgi:hypothetical protein